MLACVIIVFFTLLFQFAGALRLGIPLLYALIVSTLFHEWYYAHAALANGIWFVMLVAVAASWVITIARKVREWI